MIVAGNDTLAEAIHSVHVALLVEAMTASIDCLLDLAMRISVYHRICFSLKAISLESISLHDKQTLFDPCSGGTMMKNTQVATVT
jgi:hypothetical protein